MAGANEAGARATSGPRVLTWSSLPDLDGVAALLGEAPEDVRTLLTGLPGTAQGVAAAGEDRRPRAAALWIPPAPPASTYATLARLSAPASSADAALRLVAWAEERAREVVATSLVISERAGGVHGSLLEARGYRAVNALVRMRRAAARPVPPLPQGVAELSFADAGLDAWMEVVNASFEGVPFSLPMTPADAARQAADPAFDASLVRVVSDALGPVAFLRGVLAQDREAEVETIGVVPRARGRGLGRWALRRCEALLDARGARAVDLQVAATNAPALALYVAEGYAEISRRVTWERALLR